MKIRNTTDMSDDLVRRVIAFVRPPGVRRFDVMVRNAGRGIVHGRAFAHGHPSHRISRYGTPFIRVNVSADPDAFPLPPGSAYEQDGAYLPAPYLASRTEALVYICAHEMRHLWHARVPRGRRVWGARGQYSERDADAYAIRMLRAWRRAHFSTPVIGWTVGAQLVMAEWRAHPVRRFEEALHATRGPGEVSLVRGGILGPHEWETDVPLGRSWVRVTPRAGA